MKFELVASYLIPHTYETEPTRYKVVVQTIDQWVAEKVAEFYERKFESLIREKQLAVCSVNKYVQLFFEDENEAMAFYLSLK